MEIYDWWVFPEQFADGPERWYARHQQTEFRLAAETFDELVARICVFELGGTLSEQSSFT